MPPQKLRIIQISTRDQGGGAERVAWNLFEACRQRGHDARLMVGQQRILDDPDIQAFPNHERYNPPWPKLWSSLAENLKPLHGKLRGAWRLSQTAYQIAEPRRTWARWRGYEDFYQPGAGTLLKLNPPPHIIHAHNLHNNYFDLRLLPALSQRSPTLITLHDAWLLSGHCAHSFGCERWREGCGACPDLSIYPAIRRDATAYNWARKGAIYQASRLYISTPCQWLMNKVEASMLMAGTIETRIIPYGLDLDIFKPAPRAEVRAALGLPQDAVILLFSAASIRQNPFKDYATMRAALEIIAGEEQRQAIIFLALGEDAPPEQLSPEVQIRFIPFQADLRTIAAYYQAADLYIHAAREDTFPNAILEALACATPVIASRVGGIPEQVRDWREAESDQASGALVPMGDPAALAEAIQNLLDQADLRQKLGYNARRDAQARFDLKGYIEQHLDWYAQMQAQHAE